MTAPFIFRSFFKPRTFAIGTDGSRPSNIRLAVNVGLCTKREPRDAPSNSTQTAPDYLPATPDRQESRSVL
jgi:hypothetical protein